MGGIPSRQSVISKITTNDIIVAVVGQSGAGKSSFINTASGGRPKPVNHDLQPRPDQEVQCIICENRDYRGKRVVLVDVPALDVNSTLPQTVQRKLQLWLNQAKSRNLKITAILYLYHINQNRNSDPPMNHLCILQSLFTRFQQPFPQSIVLATTMWHDNTRERQEKRLKELQIYWDGVPFPRTPQVMQYSNTLESAWNIILTALEGIETLNESLAIQNIQKVLGKKKRYQSLLKCDDKEAQAVLNLLHKLLAGPIVDRQTRSSFLKAMLRLSSKSGLYPQCLELRGIEAEQRTINGGHFGEIYLGKFKNHRVCLKAIRINKLSQIGDLLKIFACEAILWSNLVHPNLLPFYGIHHFHGDTDRICLVSPWMENGNVREYLERNPTVSRQVLIHDIAQGLKYLHENNVVHGDLKGDNVLINHLGMACLADFGLSAVVDADVPRWTSLQTSTRLGGTVRWLSPEILDRPDDDQSITRLTFASDIWSFAAVAYEILTGRVPFYEFARAAAIIFQRIQGKLPTRPSLETASELTDVIWNLMQDCWKLNPQERPGICEIISRLPKVDRTRTSPSQNDIEDLMESVIDFRNSLCDHDWHVISDEVELLARLSGNVSSSM